MEVELYVGIRSGACHLFQLRQSALYDIHLIGVYGIEYLLKQLLCQELRSLSAFHGKSATAYQIYHLHCSLGRNIELCGHNVQFGQFPLFKHPVGQALLHCLKEQVLVFLLYLRLRLLGFIDSAIINRVAIVNRTSVVNSGIAGILNVVHIMRITYMQPSADGIGITEIQAYTTRSRFLKQLCSAFWTELAVVFLFTVRTIHILCIIRYNYFVLKTLVTAPFVVTSTMDFWV